MNFKDIQHELGEAITKTRNEDREILSDKKYKLPVSDAFFCAEDIIKNKKFYEAIGKALRDIGVLFPNEKIQVIDAGSGTGVLGILALLQGADHVSFIEANPHTLSWSKKFIEQLGLSEKCRFYSDDAMEIELPEKYHLLISETITIDFGQEDFHKIITHLKQFLVPRTIIIPEGFEILFSQRDAYNTIISENIIKRKSRENISSYREKLLRGVYSLEISGRADLYSDVSISSGEVISFFNTKTFLAEDMGAEFIWGR